MNGRVEQSSCAEMRRPPMITFPCPRCGPDIRIAPEHAGMLFGCRACGAEVQAPTSAIAGVVGAILGQRKSPRYAVGLVEQSGYVDELLFRNIDRRDKVFDALHQALRA